MVILIVAVTVWTVLSAYAAFHTRASSPRFRHRTIPPPKLLTPLDDPMGSTLDLIQWAENRAISEHRKAFPDSPDQVLRDRFLEANRTGQVTVLGNWNFSTINEKRERAGYIRMETGQYGRYLDGIGYVTAGSQEKLNRACEVVLMQRFDKHEAAIRLLDARIKAAAGIPQIDQVPLRQHRNDEWMKAMNALQQARNLYSMGVTE